MKTIKYILAVLFCAASFALHAEDGNRDLSLRRLSDPISQMPAYEPCDSTLMHILDTAGKTYRDHDSDFRCAVFPYGHDSIETDSVITSDFFKEITRKKIINECLIHNYTICVTKWNRAFFVLVYECFDHFDAWNSKLPPSYYGVITTGNTNFFIMSAQGINEFSEKYLRPVGDKLVYTPLNRRADDVYKGFSYAVYPYLCPSWLYAVDYKGEWHLVYKYDDSVKRSVVNFGIFETVDEVYDPE